MVQVYVSHLRRVLDGDGVRIVTRGRGYELQLADGEVDVVRAERLLEESRPRDALALWRGGAPAGPAGGAVGAAPPPRPAGGGGGGGGGAGGAGRAAGR